MLKGCEECFGEGRLLCLDCGAAEERWPERARIAFRRGICAGIAGWGPERNPYASGWIRAKAWTFARKWAAWLEEDRRRRRAAANARLLAEVLAERS